MDSIMEKAKQKQEFVRKIKQVIIDALDLDLSLDRFDTNAPMFGTGLGFDSIDAVEIVVSMEQEFNIKFEGQLNIYALRTVGK